MNSIIPQSPEALSINDRLEGDNQETLQRANDLVEAAERIPEVFEDDETAAKATDYLKAVAKCTKDLETRRVAEKEPFLSFGRLVDGFFNKRIAELDKAKAKAKRPLDDFLKRKADEERRRREEEARRLREEADARAREAAEREAAVRREREAAEAAARSESDRQAAALSESRETAAVERELQEAARIEMKAEVVEKQAAAPLAKLASSTGLEGAKASLRTIWVGEIVSVSELDLVQLRHHIDPAALQKALNSFVKAGGRNLRGASIYEKSEAVVR